MRLDDVLAPGPERLWFFGEEGRPAGPVPEGVLRRMLQAGEVGPGTRVWADGLRTWLPASSVADLVPEEPTAVRAELLGAWSPCASIARRAAARFLDSVPGPLVGLVVALGIARSGDPLRLAAQGLGGALLGLFVSVLVEAAFLARYGTSPGKFLLALRVRTSRQGHPTFAKALRRSLQVWWFGLGAGVPVVAPFSVTAGLRQLVRRGGTRWDRATGLRVEQRAFVARRAAA